MSPYTGPVSVVPIHARRSLAPVRPAVRKSIGFAQGPAMGQTFDELLNFHPAVGDLIRLAAHGGAGWLGIYVGTTQRGFISVAGWVLGVANGIGAALDLVSLGKRVAGTHPEKSSSESLP